MRCPRRRTWYARASGPRAARASWAALPGQRRAAREARPTSCTRGTRLRRPPSLALAKHTLLDAASVNISYDEVDGGGWRVQHGAGPVSIKITVRMFLPSLEAAKALQSRLTGGIFSAAALNYALGGTGIQATATEPPVEDPQTQRMWKWSKFIRRRARNAFVFEMPGYWFPPKTPARFSALVRSVVLREDPVLVAGPGPPSAYPSGQGIIDLDLATEAQMAIIAKRQAKWGSQTAPDAVRARRLARLTARSARRWERRAQLRVQRLGGSRPDNKLPTSFVSSMQNFFLGKCCDVELPDDDTTIAIA